MITHLNHLAREIHRNAIDKGWWPKTQAPSESGVPRDFDGLMMLVVSEAAEALEEWRAGRPYTETRYTVKWEADATHAAPHAISFDGPDTLVQWAEGGTTYRYGHDEWVEKAYAAGATIKPEGIPTELADIFIRVLDICAAYGIDLDAAVQGKMLYNSTRPFRHGGKRS